MSSNSNVQGLVVAILTGILAIVASIVLTFADRGLLGGYVAYYWGTALALFMFFIPVWRAFSIAHPNRYSITIFAVLCFVLLNVNSAKNESREWYMMGWVVLWVWAFLPTKYLLGGETQHDQPK